MGNLIFKLAPTFRIRCTVLVFILELKHDLLSQ